MRNLFKKMRSATSMRRLRLHGILLYRRTCCNSVPPSPPPRLCVSVACCSKTEAALRQFAFRFARFRFCKSYAGRERKKGILSLPHRQVSQGGYPHCRKAGRKIHYIMYFLPAFLKPASEASRPLGSPTAQSRFVLCFMDTLGIIKQTTT